MDRTCRIFTDGSAIGNPGPGGWGAVLISGRKRWEMSGASRWTTIEEMELRAAAEALRSLPTGTVVELRSDSEYLVYGMRRHVIRWQSQGWRNRRGSELKHRELWKDLVHLNSRLNIHWKWIKGHNGHPVQSRADALAYREAKSLWLTQRIAA
jgi:ribonuclease HI